MVDFKRLFAHFSLVLSPNRIKCLGPQPAVYVFESNFISFSKASIVLAFFEYRNLVVCASDLNFCSKVAALISIKKIARLHLKLPAWSEFSLLLAFAAFMTNFDKLQKLGSSHNKAEMCSQINLSIWSRCKGFYDAAWIACKPHNFLLPCFWT